MSSTLYHKSKPECLKSWEESNHHLLDQLHEQGMAHVTRETTWKFKINHLKRDRPESLYFDGAKSWKNKIQGSIANLLSFPQMSRKYFSGTEIDLM